MSRKRFIVESVMIDCLCEDEPRIAKVITDTDETYSYEDLYEVAELLNEQQATIQSLKEENEKLKNKLNVTALELVDEAISMGKAVEISEMNYPEFLEYRKKKGKPMELQR